MRINIRRKQDRGAEEKGMMKLLKVMMKEQDRSSGNGRRREADKGVGGGGLF